MKRFNQEWLENNYHYRELYPKIKKDWKKREWQILIRNLVAKVAFKDAHGQKKGSKYYKCMVDYNNGNTDPIDKPPKQLIHLGQISFTHKYKFEFINASLEEKYFNEFVEWLECQYNRKAIYNDGEFRLVKPEWLEE